ncbi:putative candidate secreted effector protein [Blumeria hordei DH14]|uniref:Putative candidate secreted effector protein n=1 Tax=Blumeria graminis f. sp. hordei (strain DH14) TaxID=546991 RepID=N1JF30_BLUG1|nr:putative candidate secreted effector protein [Blumeria hordei DH14]
MKFFSSVTTAAMAGLLLLIPAANGSYFECNSGQIFDISTVRISAAFATHELSNEITPSVPSPQERKFTMVFNSVHRVIPNLLLLRVG